MALFVRGVVDWKVRRAGQPLCDALDEAHGCDGGTRRRPHGGQNQRDPSNGTG